MAARDCVLGMFRNWDDSVWARSHKLGFVSSLLVLVVSWTRPKLNNIKINAKT